MNRLVFISILVLAFLAGSCVSASFTQTGELFPEYYGTVSVLTELPEDVEYAEIGIVSAKGGSVHNQADIIEALQKRAARNGANAIVLIGREDENVSFYGTEGGSSTTWREMTAVAIWIEQ